MVTRYSAPAVAVAALAFGLTPPRAISEQDRPVRSTPSVTWYTDLPAAEKLAAKTGKPMLLVFR